MIRDLAAALLASALLWPGRVSAEETHAETSVQDKITMDDLVREMEDLQTQRSKLRDKIRATEVEIKLLEENATTAASQADSARQAMEKTLQDDLVAATSEDEKKTLRDKFRAAEATTSATNERLKTEHASELAARKIELGQLRDAAEMRSKEIQKKQKLLVNIERSLERELTASRELRCMTALCWGKKGTQYAVEPVVDLPIGLAFSVGGGALTSYLNASKLSVEFNAGLRFWFWHDRLSFMVFFSKPVLVTTDHIKIDGSPFEHPTASVHRPYPNIGFGFLGDLLQIGFAYDVLVNGRSETDRDPRYRANQVLSRSITITVGFATVLSARTAFAEAKMRDGKKEEP